MLQVFSAIRNRWQGEVDGAGLGLMRMLVAASVLLELLQVWWTDSITDLLVTPQFHFKYALFEWIGPPQGMMPPIFVWALIAVAALVLVGWRTRWTASLMAAGYVYWFLIDAAHYSDHAYLVCVFCILVAWLPTNRWASVDAYMGREKRTVVPAWCVELVCAQLLLVFFFSALWMLNADWLNGSPLIGWVETRPEIPTASWLAGKTGLIVALAWLVPAVYLFAIPGLYWKWTRPVAMLGLAVFHLWDALAFEFSVSPWLLTGLMLVFCDPALLRRWSDRIVAAVPQWSVLQTPWRGMCRAGLILDRCVNWFDDTPLIGDARAKTVAYVEPARLNGTPSTFPASAKVLVQAWLLVQFIVPFRFVTLEQKPDWTELASTFAWRGQHTEKECELKLSAIQPSQGLRWPLHPDDDFPVPQAIFFTSETLDEKGLSEGTLKDLLIAPEETRAARFAAFKISPDDAEKIVAQYRGTLPLRLSVVQYNEMLRRPELLRQYAQRAGVVLSGLLEEEISIHANLEVRLNYRPPQQMLEDAEDFNLAAVKSVQELADKLPKLTEPRPQASEQIVAAKEAAERRRIELEEDFDIILDKSRGKGEPQKAPAISDEDERWYQEHFARK